PYKFYQYWLNTSDEDAENFIKIFTFLSKEEIESLTEDHRKAPHTRLLQKKLADEITTLVHSQKDLDNAKKASQVLVGKFTTEDLKTLDDKTFLDVFEGVTKSEISKDKIVDGLDIIAALSADTCFLKSNGEARRALKQNAVSVNKEKVDDK